MANKVYFSINGKEAYEHWGVYMGEGSLTALMTPAAAKDYVESESALEYGCRVQVPEEGIRLSSREVTITLFLTAPSVEEFLQRYASLCEEFERGWLHIRTHLLPDTVYHCLFMSCNEFKQYDRELAMFSLRLKEPNPKNRT